MLKKEHGSTLRLVDCWTQCVYKRVCNVEGDVCTYVCVSVCLLTIRVPATILDVTVAPRI